MRPHSIKLFAAAFLAQAAVAFAHGIYAAEREILRFQEYFSANTSETLLPFVLALRLGIPLLLTWLVWARASRFAKWAIVTLLALRVIRVPDALTGLATANVNSIIWTLGSVLGLVAVICLFLPESRYWFARKGALSKSDAAVFE